MGQDCEIQHYGVQYNTFTSQTMLYNDTSSVNDLNPRTVMNTNAAAYISSAPPWLICLMWNYYCIIIIIVVGEQVLHFAKKDWTETSTEQSRWPGPVDFDRCLGRTQAQSLVSGSLRGTANARHTCPLVLQTRWSLSRILISGSATT